MNNMIERSKQNYEDYYEIIKVIGIGGYGCVFKGRDKQTKELRAIKVMNIDKIKENLLIKYEREELKEQLKLCIDGFIEEFEIMKICSQNNKNSVKCYEYFNNKENFVIIMELCDKNLSELLNKKYDEEGKGLNLKEIHKIMKQLNNTFKIMKKNNIIHRDLKLENILIKYINDNKDYIIKLTDYGCSKRLISLTKNCKTYTGTLVYMAPEILKEEEYNYKCDLWSVGIIIYRLIFGKSPYLGENEKALINNIDKLGNKIIKETENKKLNDLIKRLLEKEPINRINWDEYLNHEYFKSKSKFRSKINLKYNVREDGYENIFGEKFVKNNIKNIEIEINGKKNELVKEYELKEGENNIKIIIKKEIYNLEEMFSKCSSLINIDELKYLDTRKIKNFSYMFMECKSLTDIKSLENWNVSNGNDFSYMFCYCTSLSDIKSLKNWNVSNGNNFSYMFNGCIELKDIKSLENWNVSNGNDFSGMFNHCSSLSNIKSLKNWNVSNGINFSSMFKGCSSLSNIKSLEKWNVSNGIVDWAQSPIPKNFIFI